MLVLAEFDVRVGNRVIWCSNDVNKADISGIEFQMIPSGLHDVISDTIYFSCGKYMGIAVFSAKSVPTPAPNNRRSMRIYSLAALDKKSVPYKLETWLRALLEKYIVVNDPSLLETPGEIFKDPSVHPILAAPDYIQMYGPLMFELWKAGLCRQRLILHSPGMGVKKLSQFCHLTGIIGSIPADVAHLLPSNSPPLDYSCLYNVTLIDTQRLRSRRSFCACTTDTLLVLPDRDICDLVIDNTGLHHVDGTPVYPTWRDRHRFTVKVEELCPSFTSTTHPLSYILDRLAESAMQGLLWWASAGDTCLVNEQLQTTPDTPDIEGVALVGLFHNYTRELIKSFAALAQDYDNIVLIGVDDMAQMGLDALSIQDRRFIERFSLVWFDRVVHFKNLCCCL